MTAPKIVRFLNRKPTLLDLIVLVITTAIMLGMTAVFAEPSPLKVNEWSSSTGWFCATEAGARELAEETPERIVGDRYDAKAIEWIEKDVGCFFGKNVPVQFKGTVGEPVTWETGKTWAVTRWLLGGVSVYAFVPTGTVSNEKVFDKSRIDL
jgi:hypothetical protein